jgi:aminoglycoside phosphotransferase (APT) family kinase protein
MMAVTRLAGLDPASVEDWLAAHVEGLARPLSFALVSGGRSNLTYAVTDAAGTRYALRRPPTGGVLGTAHDMRREWAFVSALAPTRVPVATPVGYCDDAAVTGAEFFVTGFVDGLVLGEEADGERLSPPARARVGEQLVQVLVELHALDPHAVGLGAMVRDEGYVERQLRRWQRQVHEWNPRLLAHFDEVHGLLAARVPEQGVGIVHGDYRPGNAAFGPDGTLRAVFDWELATCGDPIADLGWMLASWRHAGDAAAALLPGPTGLPGFPSRTEVATRYAALSGRDVGELPFHIAFARWRMACTLAGVHARYRDGHMADDGYAEQVATALEQMRRLLEAARDGLRTGRLD